MIQLISSLADVLRQYDILRLCFFRLFIGQFSSLSLKRQNDAPYAILAWLLPGYFFSFFEWAIYWRSTNSAFTQAISVFSNYNCILYFMKSPNERDRISVIEKSAEELHEKIDMHRCLMTTVLNQRLGDGSLKRISLPPILLMKTGWKRPFRRP